MKKILITLILISAATLTFMGCKFIFGTTYSVTSGGYCYEITTSETSVIVALELIGAEEEPCDTDNAAASCTVESDVYNQEMVNYYSADYLTLYSDLEEECTAEGGTWKDL